MKIALIMNHNSYVGREYASRMIDNNIKFDILSIGDYPSINKIEEDRCGGLWSPPSFKKIIKKRKVYNFSNLSCKSIINFLQSENYSLGIQGGTGIIKKNLIIRFKIGILNFHPGDLPYYRGCSAPEWQIHEDNPIISTCHLVDEGIDTGPIYKKKKLLKGINSTYHELRSDIYPLTANFVVEVLEKLLSTGEEEFFSSLYTQDESKAKYRKYIGDHKIPLLKEKLPKKKMR